MRLSYCALLLLLGMPAMVMADAVPGKPAPPFEVKDARGHVQKLSDYQGKWLVLEWFNKDCPYVRKHYGSGNMQGLQQRYVTQGVAWLSVISSAPGKQGYVEPAEALNTVKTTKSAASQVLLDPSGTMGKRTAPKRRRTCSSSTPRGPWSMPAGSTTTTPPTLPSSQRRKIM